MDHADFDEEKFKEAMVKVHELRSSEEKQKSADYHYWKGYSHEHLSIYATADQWAEYNQGAEDRKRERES